MKNLGSAISIEVLKVRRSKILVFSTLGFMLLPVVCGFFMLVLKDPELARRLGLISTKAHMMAGDADWPTFFRLLAQATGGGGVVLFSLIGTWVFGREYSDHTVKDLLALPTPRSAIIVAKFVLIAIWSCALTALIGVVALCIGAGVGLGELSGDVLVQGAGRVIMTAALVIALVAPIAFFASAGRGYLMPLGMVFLALLMSQVLTGAGWGEYFPWAVPNIYAQEGNVATTSIIIVLLTSAAGVTGTLLWWKLADQTG